MTAYNREKYTTATIENVWVGMYTNFELINIDDCSSDRIVEIARTYEVKDRRVKEYTNETRHMQPLYIQAIGITH